MKIKHKNLRMIISLIIAICIWIPTLSKAETIDEIKTGSNEGKNLYLSYNTLQGRNDLYCIQHGAPLSGTTTYTVQKYIKIVGNEATNTNKQKTVSKANGIMAYIIGQKQGYGSVGNYTSGQIAMYSYINTWFSISGSKLGINLADIRNNVYTQNDIITQAREYAQNIGNSSSESQIENNTNRDRIKVTRYEENNVSYIRVGPFKYTFPGKIEEITVKDQNKKTIKDIKYSIYKGNTEKFIKASEIKSGQNFYISIKADENVSKITQMTGKVKSQSQTLTAEMWFLTSAYKQNLLLVEPGKTDIPNEFDFKDDYDIPLTGKIGIIKVDADNQKMKLSKVVFKVKSKDTGKYIKREGNNIKYVDEEQAEKFETDEEGKILIENVLIGKYQFIEISNPHYGYEINNKPIEVETNTGNARYTTITNKQKYIKLSGYVWEDRNSGKKSIRNNLYQTDSEDYKDDKDILVQGIKVTLKDKNGNIVNQTETDQKGKYVFENLLIDELANYDIEFQYDGLIYENVDIHLDKAKGSKASEGTEREDFNNKFARIDAYSKDTVSVKSLKDSNLTEQYKIQYKLDAEKHTAEILKTNCSIIASTKKAGYTITVEKGKGITEITDVNLGIYKREQTDLALMQDVDQVRIGLKGYEHIYKYSSRFNNNEAIEDAWNIGVKFENKYGAGSYQRPIYKADAEYYDETKPSDSLRMFITYKIGLRNQASITSKINSIVDYYDYYDEKYTGAVAGTGIDAKGNITENLTITNAQTTEQGYGAIEIDTSSIIIPVGTTKYIYIQFELPREKILELLNEAEATNNNTTSSIKNVAEIKSYTSYIDANATKLYAAVDKDSVVGNTTPGNKTTYEDDTDVSPNVGLTIADARAISGKVFEDNADSELLEKQNIRQGNGIYEDQESKIGGVTVQMVEVENNGNTKVISETQTAQDGTYRFTEFTPGNYIIQYIWGDGMYKVVDQNTIQYENTVENYKSTIFEEERYKQETTEKKYYQTNTGVSQTHATDDWALRQKIDKEANSHDGGENNGYNYSTTVTTRQMTSTTPTMEFGIEYKDTDLDNVTLINNEIKFEVKNMDFGLIERAKQGILLRKRVAHLTIKLADGQTIADADVNEDGTLSGQKNYLTYMQPSVNNGTYNRGFLKAEIDKELMQTAYVEIKYEFEIINTSESDFASEGYYKFGNSYYTSKGKTGEMQKENDIVTMSPTKIIDYLDTQTIFKTGDETNLKYGWKQATMQDIQTSKLVATNVTEDTSLGNKVNVYVTEYLKDTKLKPVLVISNEKKPADIAKIYLVAEKTLAPDEEANYINQAEIIEINKPFGSKLTSTPGNYKPFGTEHETDDSTAEEVIIMPTTGGNKNYINITIISIVALAILGTGVFFIKRKFQK